MNGLYLLSTFKNISVDYFYSDVQSVDFSNPGQAAEIINTWVGFMIGVLFMLIEISSRIYIHINICNYEHMHIYIYKVCC